MCCSSPSRDALVGVGEGTLAASHPGPPLCACPSSPLPDGAVGRSLGVVGGVASSLPHVEDSARADVAGEGGKLARGTAVWLSRRRHGGFVGCWHARVGGASALGRLPHPAADGAASLLAGVAMASG
jgi:hypothetical protein